MSDLDDFRDHARAMANASHRTDCRQRLLRAADELSREEQNYVTFRSCGDKAAHGAHRRSRWLYCPGACEGCNDDADRERWRMLADEVDDYLAPADEGEGLFA